MVEKTYTKKHMNKTYTKKHMNKTYTKKHMNKTYAKKTYAKSDNLTFEAPSCHLNSCRPTI